MALIGSIIDTLIGIKDTFRNEMDFIEIDAINYACNILEKEHKLSEKAEDILRKKDDKSTTEEKKTIPVEEDKASTPEKDAKDTQQKEG